MKKHLKGLALGLGCAVYAGLTMTSCVDSNYDLAHLNTDIQVNVNDLTIPLNLDTIKLKQVMKVKDGDIIQLDTMFDAQGKIVKKPGTDIAQMIYVAKKEGSFESQPITIKSTTAPSPVIQPIEDKIDLKKLFDVPATVKKDGLRMVVPKIPATANDTIAAYILSSKPTFFKATASNIDTAVVDLTDIKVTTTFTIPLTISDLTTVLNPIHFAEFKLQLPSGLKAKFYLFTSATDSTEIPANKYDEYSGVLNLGDVTLYDNSSVYASKLKIVVSKLEGINETWGCVTFDDETRELTFSDSLRIVEGGIAIRMKDFKNYDPTVLPCTDPTQTYKYAAWAQHYKDLVNSLPAEVTYKSAPKIDPVQVNAFSGEIQYTFQGLNIDPIQINNVPELLKKQGTDIFLNNPQIYMSINNPLREKNLEVTGTAGFSLESAWSDSTKKTCSLDKDTLIVMDKAHMQFMLSPENKLYKKYPYKYAQHVPYTSLSELLANDGKGLPSKININVIKPGIPLQPVTDFPLGATFNKVEGKYMLYAPLQLATLISDSILNTTKISYEDSVDIEDDIFKDLVIEDISLDFKVDNEIPLELELYVYPKETVNGKKQRMKDEDGEEISFEIEGVIEALAKAQDVEAVLSEAIPEGHTLTGIDFEAYLRTEDGDYYTVNEVLEELPSLAPEMGIKMSELKIRLSGHYKKKL